MYARSKKCVGVDPLCIPAYPSMLNPFLGLPPGSLHTPSKPLYVKLSPFLAASPPKPSLFSPQALHFRNPRLSVIAFCLLNHQLESWRGGFRAAFDKKEWGEMGVAWVCDVCFPLARLSNVSAHTVAQRTGQTVRSQRNQYKCPTAQFSLWFYKSWEIFAKKVPFFETEINQDRDGRSLFPEKSILSSTFSSYCALVHVGKFHQNSPLVKPICQRWTQGGQNR